MMAEISHNPSSFERVHEAASFLQERLPAPLRSPHVAIVCGTGLGGLVHTIEHAPRAEFDYSSIPHFPHLTGKSHWSQVKLCSYCQVIDCWWSRWTCGETGIWSSRSRGPASPCCFDAWSRTVSSPYVDWILHWLLITIIINFFLKKKVTMRATLSTK